MEKVLDMTAGKPLRLLVSFAVPLFLSNLCQQLYTIADSVVVGRLIGVDAFAAVGASGFLSWLFVDILIGFSQGFGVFFGQRFGKKDFGGLHKGTAMSMFLFLILGAVLTAAGLLGAKPILVLTGTPTDILPDTLLYLYWILGGILITCANRLSNTLLMSLGNSRAPLTATILSSIVNVILDVLFVSAFHWGISGVAAATLLAQLLSFFHCLGVLRKIPEARLSKGDFRPDKAALLELLRLGAPLGFRNAVISSGGLLVQSAVNAFGKLFIAGVTAAKKYFGFMELISGALEAAFATFTAQNFGCGRLDRVKTGLRYVLRIAVIGSLSITLLAVLFGKPMISLLVGAQSQEAVIQAGYENLLVIGAGLPSLYLLYVYRSGLEGLGNSVFPMLSGFLELAMRILSVVFLPSLIGRWGVYLADVLGWVCAFVLLFFSYRAVYRRRQREADPASSVSIH